MLVFGRSPNLILGFLTAAFNVAVVGHILGFNPTPELIAAVNILLGSAVGLIANSDTITTAAATAAAARSNGAK